MDAKILRIGIALVIGVALWIGFIQLTNAAVGVDIRTNGMSQGFSDERYINTANENDIFELDSSGDVMPSVAGKIDVHFEEDSNNDIQPKDQDCFSQDANGDYQPVE